jgi:hypothetical protein
MTVMLGKHFLTTVWQGEKGSGFHTVVRKNIKSEEEMLQGL